jgi:hypothetical protein
VFLCHFGTKSRQNGAFSWFGMHLAYTVSERRKEFKRQQQTYNNLKTIESGGKDYDANDEKFRMVTNSV